MRQSDDACESSLELLLDTICNTFGGILFLAVLVLILLRMARDVHAPEQAPEPNTVELAELEQQLDETLTELTSLRQATIAQRALAAQLLRGDAAERYEEFLALEAQRNHLSTERMEILNELASVQGDINAAAAELQELDDDLVQNKDTLRSVEETFRSEVAARTRTTNLPRTRSTFKVEIALAMRYGRVYFVHDLSGSLLSRQLNTDDMVVFGEDGLYTRATPKPYSGLIVDESQRFETALAGRLRRLDRSGVYFAILVWDDSFEQFALLKNALVEVGYEYRLLPMLQGESITEGHVANPLVQ